MSGAEVDSSLVQLGLIYRPDAQLPLDRRDERRPLEECTCGIATHCNAKQERRLNFAEPVSVRRRVAAPVRRCRTDHCCHL